jgi:hypothetical protein
MRKLILVAAMVLVSATAQAGATLASSNGPANVEQSRAAEAPRFAASHRPSMRYQGGHRLHRPHLAMRGGLKRRGFRGFGLLSRIKYAFHRRGIFRR